MEYNYYVSRFYEPLSLSSTRCFLLGSLWFELLWFALLCFVCTTFNSVQFSSAQLSSFQFDSVQLSSAQLISAFVVSLKACLSLQCACTQVHQIFLLCARLFSPLLVLQCPIYFSSFLFYFDARTHEDWEFDIINPSHDQNINLMSIYVGLRCCGEKCDKFVDSFVWLLFFSHSLIFIIFSIRGF